MVMMRAPARTRRPVGLSAVAVKPRLMPCSAGFGSSAGAPSSNLKLSWRVRVKNSGPMAQLSRDESPD